MAVDFWTPAGPARPFEGSKKQGLVVLNLRAATIITESQTSSLFFLMAFDCQVVAIPTKSSEGSRNRVWKADPFHKIKAPSLPV